MSKILSRFLSMGVLLSGLTLTVGAQTILPDLTARVGGTQNGLQRVFSQKTVEVNTGISDIRGFRVKPQSKRQNVRQGEAAAVDVPVIYGCCIYADTWGTGNQPSGFYKLPQSAEQDSEMMFSGPMANYGGVCVDGIYYATQYVNVMGMFQYTDVSGYDIETGTRVRSLTAGNDALAKGLDIDPVTGAVYGITYNTDGNALQLTKLEYGETEVIATRIAGINGNWCGFCIDKDGQFYGLRQDLNIDGTETTVVNTVLCKIDRETASFTEVGVTGVNSSYLGGFCIDRKTGRMFQSINLEDVTGHLYEINPATGVATELFQFKDNGEYVGIYVPASAAEDGAPAVCENVEVVFMQDALTGKVSLTAPSTLYDGSTASGEVTIHVLANGEEVAQSVLAYGQSGEMVVDLTETGSGLYDFIVYASNSIGDGPKTVVKAVWVGADTPSATTATLAYANGNMEVSWLPVTGSVNGGYVDVDNVTYTVKRSDGSVAAEGLTVTSFTEAVAEPDNLTDYYYTVFAVSGDLVSAGARTNVVTLGAITPPYNSTFATTYLDGWTVIDANGDRQKWLSMGGPEVVIGFNMFNDMDDWLISPPLRLEEGKAYTLTFKSHGEGPTYPERIEVKLGNAPTAEAMTTILVEPTDLTTVEPVDFTSLIIPETTGKYYIGFHGISPANRYNLYVSDVVVSEGVSSDVPAEAQNLTVTPAANGAFSANITFYAPATTVAGTALTELVKVELTRNGELIKTFENPVPGAPLSYDDELTAGGEVTYGVTGYSAEGQGQTVTASAIIGYDKPADQTGVTISRTAVDGEVIVSWDAVTCDINGLVYQPGTVTYNVYDYSSGELELISEGIEGTSYSYQAVEAGNQQFVQSAVIPVANGLQGYGLASDLIACGTPYPGMHASFPNGTLGGYIWASSNGATPEGLGGAKVSLYLDGSLGTAADGDGGFAAFNCNTENGSGMFISGLVSLEGMVDPGVSFYTYNILDANGTPDTNLLNVYVRPEGTTGWQKVFGSTVVDIVGEGINDWGMARADLSAYANQTVEIAFEAVTKVYVYTMIDNIRVASMLDHDLRAVDITAPETAICGQNFTISVEVANDGLENTEEFSVELYADEQLVATKSVDGLESYETETVYFVRQMPALQVSAVTYFAKVVYPEDQNMLNNQTGNVVVIPEASSLPAPAGLTASSQSGGIELSWVEPDLDSYDNGDETLQLTGYNVYRDGIRLNAELVEETEYLDTEVVDGQTYTYVVTAVYSGNIESGASAECVYTYIKNGVQGIEDGIVIRVEGHDIEISGAEGLRVNVTRADGAVISSRTAVGLERVTVDSGVYIVTVGNKTAKLTIR